MIKAMWYYSKNLYINDLSRTESKNRPTHRWLFFVNDAKSIQWGSDSLCNNVNNQLSA